MIRRFHRLLFLVGWLVLAGCVSPDIALFESEPASRKKLLELVPPGTPIAQAKKRLEEHGFECSYDDGVSSHLQPQVESGSWSIPPGPPKEPPDARPNEPPPYLDCHSSRSRGQKKVDVYPKIYYDAALRVTDVQVEVERKN